MCAVLNCSGPERTRLCHFWLPLSKMSLGNSSCTEGDTVEHLHLPFNRERWVIDCSWRCKAGVCSNIVIHRYITWLTQYGNIHCVQISIFTVISTITWQWYDQQWHLSRTMELSTQHKPHSLFGSAVLHDEAYFYVMNCEMGINVACHLSPYRSRFANNALLGGWD